MPLRANTQLIPLPGFIGGLNREADEFQLDPNETPEALNVDFGLRGHVRKRKGYSKFSTADPASMSRGEHLFLWETQGGSTHKIYVDSDGDVLHSTGTAFTQAATAAPANVDLGSAASVREFPVGFASMDNVLYITSVRGNPYKFDGTTWTEITDTTLNGGGSEFPKAAFIIAQHERMFAFDVSESSEFRSRVWFSEAGDAETWGANDWIDVNPDDGQKITGAVAFGENLVIFKNRSVYLLGGHDPTSFTLFPLDTAAGTESPLSVVSMGDRLMFFDAFSGVWAFNGASFDQLDEKINNYLLDNINVGQHHRAYAFSYRNKYFLSLPWQANLTPNRMFVYDLNLDAWTEYDFGVSSSIQEDDDVYSVGNKAAVGVFKMFDTQNDDGAAVAAHLETPWMNPANLSEDGESFEGSIKSRLRRVDLAFGALGDYDVTVEMYRDFGLDVYKTQDVNTDPGGSEWGTMVWGTDAWGTGSDQVLVRETGWGKLFEVMKLRFENSVVDQDFQLNRVVLHVSSRSRIRGET